MTGILVRGEARTCTGRLPCAREAKAGVMGWEPEQGGRMPSPGPQSEQHPEVTALWQF